MGGHYEPHYDMKTLKDMENQGGNPPVGGNRVATVLTYFDETIAGGATIFTDGGARIAPEKVGGRF